MDIGIVGGGFVGGATAQFSENPKIYDIDPTKCVGVTEISDLNDCDIVFVCVPTPSSPSGRRADTTIMREVVEALKTGLACERIVIRSTCPPGTARELGVSCMPEFLTERRAALDFRECPLWVLGTSSSMTTALVQRMITHSKASRRPEGSGVEHDTLRVLAEDEAEMVKYVKNTFLSVKVSFFNEIYRACAEAGVDFDRVRSAATADPRIGASHSHVPGPDGLRGFGGHCFPKDCRAFCAFSSDSTLVSAALRRNDRTDRVQVSL